MLLSLKTEFRYLYDKFHVLFVCGSFQFGCLCSRCGLRKIPCRAEVKLLIVMNAQPQKIHISKKQYLKT